jgi:hypothetical protein
MFFPRRRLSRGNARVRATPRLARRAPRYARPYRSSRSRSYRRRSYRPKRKYRKCTYNRLSVGDKVTKYISRTVGTRISTSNDKKTWAFATLNLGLHDESTLNDIYTKEAFTNEEQRVVITGQYFNMRIKNQSDMGCYITLYQCQLKTNWNVAGLGSLQGSTIDAGFQAVGLANNSEQENSVRLSMNHIFFNYWRILKKRRIYLAPQQVINHSMNSSFIHMRNFHYKLESATYLQGAKYVLWECEGVPTHDQTTAGDVGLSSVSCDVWITKNTSYKVPAPGSVTVDHNVETTLPVTPVGFVNEDLAEDAQEV